MPTSGLPGRDRALALAVPLLMLTIAGIAAVRYHSVDQSSWQGVGFGMFATHEYTPSRTVRAWTVEGSTRTSLPIPADLASEVERVLTAPGDAQTKALADELRTRSRADAVRVEVWGHDVETVEHGLEIGFRLLRSVTSS